MRRDLLVAAALAAMFEPLPPPKPEPKPRSPDDLEPWQRDVLDATMREAVPGLRPVSKEFMRTGEPYDPMQIIEATPRLPRAVWRGDPDALARAEAKRARKAEKRLRERR